MRLLPHLLAAAVVFGAAPPPRPLVLKAARMFIGNSDGVISPGLVVVVDGKISGVGAGAVIPADAQTVDLGDATLMPGFIDAHTHLSGDYEEDWKGALIGGLQKPVAEMALDAIGNLKVTLMAGFLRKLYC